PGPRHAAAPGAAGRHARPGRRRRHGAVSARGDARGHPPGLHPHRPRQGSDRAAGAAAAPPAQRRPPYHHATGAVAAVPAHRGRARRDGVLLAGDGEARRGRHLCPRLSRRHRRRHPRRGDGRLEQRGRGPAHRRRGPARPPRRARRGLMLQTWLSLGALVAAATGGTLLLRRHSERTARGRRFFRHPTSTTGVAVLAFFVLVAVFAPLVAPYDPAAQPDPVGLQNRPPSWLHPLGTDLYSHDILSRVAYGARVSLGVGTLAMLVAVTLGAVVGAVAGYMGRWVDAILMRLVDVGIAVPRMF